MVVLPGKDKYQNNEKTKQQKYLQKKAKEKNIYKSKFRSHAPQFHTHKHAHTIIHTYVSFTHIFAYCNVHTYNHSLHTIKSPIFASNPPSSHPSPLKANIGPKSIKCHKQLIHKLFI